MKKLMILILALMLCLPALAESTAAIPLEIVEERAQNHIQIGLDEAINKAMSQLPVKPDQYQVRAEVAKMSDDSFRWIVTVFDLTSLSDGWCVEIDAYDGAVKANFTTYDGFFRDPYDRWTAQKGIHALWSLEDKQRFDTLYALMPGYGLPQANDMSAGNALTKALFVLGLPSSEGYAVGYGYLMGGEDYNGVWEITLVKNSQVAYRVNLDAVTGDVYYMEPDEAGNG